MNLIELNGVDFSYSEGEPLILEGFDFAVEKGEFIVIEGDNGSGKTTLFRILNGISFPLKGSYVFDSEAITKKYLDNNKNSKLFHKRIGYLFQNPDVMLFNARVYDEISFGPRQMGLSDEEVNARVIDCMKLFDIEKLSGKAPYHLSEVQKKKVALASVLALNPEVLVLDEPFAGLDQKSSNNLMDLLTDLKKAGKTILIATHNPKVKEILTDRVVELSIKY